MTVAHQKVPFFSPYFEKRAGKPLLASGLREAPEGTLAVSGDALVAGSAPVSESAGMPQLGVRKVSLLMFAVLAILSSS